MITLQTEENKRFQTTIVAVDPETDLIPSFSLEGEDAHLFTLDAKSGNLTLNHVPDFERPDDRDRDNIFDLTVVALDPVDPALVTRQAIEVSVVDVPETLYQISIDEVNTRSPGELIVFSVEDSSGVIVGVDGSRIAPNNPGYVDAVLSEKRFDSGLSQVALSVLASDNPSGLPSGFNFDTIRSLNFNRDDSLGFLFIVEGTVQEFSIGKTPSVLIGSTVVPGGSNSFNLEFSDGGIDLGSFKFQLLSQSGLPDPTQGLQAQGLEVIDLRETEMVTATFSVLSEAAFSNLVGFYRAVDETGGIDTDGDGVVDFNPGDQGFVEAAIHHRLDLAITATGGQINATLAGGGVLVPFLVANDTNLDDGFDRSQVFFPYIEANADGVDHVLLLGNNTFGFEDITGGGDRDFDDLIVTIELTGSTDAVIGRAGANVVDIRDSLLNNPTVIAEFNPIEGDRLQAEEIAPDTLFNAGEVEAIDLFSLFTQAFVDRAPLTPGNQSLGADEATFIASDSGQFLIVNDSNPEANVDTDLFVRFDNFTFQPGDQVSNQLMVANYFSL